MKKLLTLLLSIMAVGLSVAAETDADFFVSPKGSDSWSGTLAEPDEAGTDGPFATLAGARDAVRKLKQEKKGDIVVLIRGGTYQLKETVVFGLQDSGAADSTITYAAYPDETPVFSAGKEIEGWKKLTEDLPALPGEAKGKVWVANVSDSFLTLYDGEGLLPRARSEKFMPSGGAVEFKFPKGKLKSWPNISDVEILVRPTRQWMMNILPLASVDEKAGTARVALQATYGMGKYGAWVENVLEELDEPGEWVLNTQEGKVYLWPRSKTPAVAASLIEYILIEGKIDEKGPTDTPVRNLRFRGLTFKHGERYSLNKDDAGTQHDWDMFDKANTLVRLRGTENCTIEKCHFLHSGSGAIRIDLHGQKNTISGNHIEHMGGGGILLCGYPAGTKDVNKNNLVQNNNIHHVSEIYWHSPGIHICMSGDNRVANNLIHHTNYSGIIVSGIVTRFFKKSNKRESMRSIRWFEIGKLPKSPEIDDVRPFLHTRNNRIEYNEIYDVMRMLGDGNGIYVRGSGPGNVIHGNYIHHMLAKTNAQGAMRTDGGQMDTLFTQNLIYKCKSQGMTVKLNNRFENNIIADIIAPRGTYLKIVEGPSTGASNKKNIYYSTLADCDLVSEPGSGKGLVGEDRRGRVTARMADVDSDDNIYFCKADPTISQKTLDKLKSEGVDKNSLSADPMFVDPENGDFSFKPDSPAIKLGIIPFDTSKAGLLTKDN